MLLLNFLIIAETILHCLNHISFSPFPSCTDSRREPQRHEYIIVLHLCTTRCVNHSFNFIFGSFGEGATQVMTFTVLPVSPYAHKYTGTHTHSGLCKQMAEPYKSSTQNLYKCKIQYTFF